MALSLQVKPSNTCSNSRVQDRSSPREVSVPFPEDSASWLFPCPEGQTLQTPTRTVDKQNEPVTQLAVVSEDDAPCQLERGSSSCCVLVTCPPSGLSHWLQRLLLRFRALPPKSEEEALSPSPAGWLVLCSLPSHRPGDSIEVPEISCCMLNLRVPQHQSCLVGVLYYYSCRSSYFDQVAQPPKTLKKFTQPSKPDPQHFCVRESHT